MTPNVLNPRPVVSNTTPLITLTGVGLLELLPALYREIWIPQAVYSEYQVGHPHYPDSIDLDSLPWLSVHSVSLDPNEASALDAGEAETIALAQVCKARLVLLDERRGRREAARLELPVAGSLTVLLVAKQQGLIPAVGPILDQIVAQGRRLSVALRAQVLELAEE